MNDIGKYKGKKEGKKRKNESLCSLLTILNKNLWNQILLSVIRNLTHFKGTAKNAALEYVGLLKIHTLD